jgi:hypothetical protein
VSLAEAMTLDCLIASNETLQLQTLVHELIHAIQYRALGIDAFAARYVAEYLSYGYEQMPWKGRQRTWLHGFSGARAFRQKLRLPIF